ncbi:non-canonical purine NTP pyrophosphatase [Candidatus Woesearchaeota archaeon]|jgi:XTP/dITP diphosphohydrolase|nr:non-canonical purine NTP pyrophosphatase [Candidatus Woesearchaeota archaeon]MDP7244603.1 non-canonical purine NTP pyrophosphatase [Flavobacteriales bacterium]
MEINLVTSNLGKVKEFKAILGNSIKINHIEMEYRELRSDNPEEIARDAAKMLADKLQKPIVVEDSGLFIKALNDFPGTCSSYIHKRIGLKGILKLMENIDDRTCYYKSAVGYCEPGKEPVSFLGEEKGTVAEEVKGNYGFGHDPIFIPEDTRTTSGINSVGSEETYGEMENCENLKRFRKIAVEKLKKCLKR